MLVSFYVKYREVALLMSQADLNDVHSIIRNLAYFLFITAQLNIRGSFHK